MRKLLTILLLLATLFAKANTIIFNHSTNPSGGVIISGDPLSVFYYPVAPGDLINIYSDQQWSYFSMSDYNFPDNNRVNIVNAGIDSVRMSAGFSLRNVHGINIKGVGTLNLGVYCGFQIDPLGNPGQGQAISVQGRSSDIEISNVGVHTATYGVVVKEDPNTLNHLVDSLQYPNYHINNVYIHHCRFINIGQDNGYLGNTDPTGQGRTYNGTEHATAMRVSNIRMLYCYVDSCNRSGNQISGADSGFNEFAFDTVKNTGYEYNFQQGGGLLIGGMAYADVHDNIIDFTFNPGITSFGIGLSKIYNNKITHTGMLIIDTTRMKQIHGSSWTMDTLILFIHNDNAANGRGSGYCTYNGDTLFNTFFYPPPINIDTRPPYDFFGVSTNNQGAGLDSTKVWIWNNTIGTSLSRNDIYVYQSYRTYFYSGSVICNNFKLDGTTPVHVSYRGATDDPDLPLGYVFNYSTDCSLVSGGSGGEGGGGGGGIPIIQLRRNSKVIPIHSLIKINRQ